MSVKITYRNSFSGEVHDTLEAAAKHSNEFHHDCIGELIDEQLALRDLGCSVIGMKLKIVDAIVDDRPALLKVLKDWAEDEHSIKELQLACYEER
jgi:hypothetical protein